MQYILTILLLLFLGLGPVENLPGEKDWAPELNSAKDAAYMNKVEREVIHELNKVRSNPRRYAEQYMEELRSAFKGKLFYPPGKEVPVKTQEGIRPLEECIRVLKKTDPRPLLQPAKGLAQAAAELVDDQQKHGGIGHISRKGANPQKRIERYGKWDVCASEDITYGSMEARQIVISLLIDDGVPNRGHRKNILNPCTHFAGAATGSHPTYRNMCVIDYAGSYSSK